MSRRAIVCESGSQISNFMPPVPDILRLLGVDFRVLPGRGRPRRDPLEALRSRIWYWHVKVVSGLTDYQLNARFAREDSQGHYGAIPAKVFERIRRDGVVPKDVPGDGLVDRVDADVTCRGTALIFRSNFWDLLKEPSQSVHRLKLSIDRQSQLLRVGRITNLQAWGQKKKEGSRRPIDSSEDYRHGVVMLTGIGTLESATLLGLLYKEAIIFGEPALATQLKAGFISTIGSYVGRLRRTRLEPYMLRHLDSFERDINLFREFAINRVIFTGREEAMPGDYVEVHYPFFLLSEAPWKED